MGSRPAGGGNLSNCKWGSNAHSLFYHPTIVLIMKYCQKRLKITNHPSEECQPSEECKYCPNHLSWKDNLIKPQKKRRMIYFSLFLFKTSFTNFIVIFLNTFHYPENFHLCKKNPEPNANINAPINVRECETEMAHLVRYKNRKYVKIDV